ncbi:MAG: hypothetical protein J6Z14_06345 [Prevotella sp.]|nr:hypothetical protein [Prevotella sp.]
MNDNERMIQVERWLRLIERTRLFCNTADELGQMVGFSVSSRNSLSRKGGNSLFMKEAIFHQLCHICKEQTGLDLQEIVEAYEYVDDFIDRYATLLRDEKVLSQTVDIFYGSGDVPEELAFVKKRLEEKHIPILFLMLTGGLPRMSARGGDVQNIQEDFRRSFMLLRGLCKNLFLQELPAISIMESGVRTNPEKWNRLHLIYVTSFILNAYGAISTQERLSLANREMIQRRIEPNVEGIWTEDDSFTTFWYFEKISNGYYLYHYKLNGQRELAYTKYFVSFYKNDDDSVEAVVVHPKSIRYIVNNQPIPIILVAYQYCQLTQDEINLTPQNDGNDWFSVSRLRRSSHAEYLQKLIDDDSRKRVNECSDTDYSFTNCLAAITPEHIYMERSEGGYYKIPKSLNDVLYDVQIDDNAGIMRFEGLTSVAFDDKSLYYDVTTEEKMGELGIRVVDVITK